MKLTDVDVLIIGAGPAGSTAAALLQREGFKLLVVEKQTFPRFVIGESLLPHCMDLLQEAGLLENVVARNFMQKNGAVFHRDGQTCNFDFAAQFTAGDDRQERLKRRPPGVNRSFVRRRQMQSTRIVRLHDVNGRHHAEVVKG